MPCLPALACLSVPRRSARRGRFSVLVSALLALLAGSLMVAAPSHAVERAAADTGADSATDYTGLYNVYDLAQTFTSAQSGELTRVVLPLSKQTSRTDVSSYPWEDLTVQLRNVTPAGKPGTAVLAQATVPHSAVDGSVETPLTGSIGLASGMQYAIVASTETPQHLPTDPFATGWYQWNHPATPYGGGAEWYVFDYDPGVWNGGHWDLGLRVYVDDPPPSDTSAPTVDLRSPTDGQRVVRGSSLIADFSCADEAGGSGIAGCVGDAADGAALDTSSVGLKSFKVEATDNANNRASKAHSYRVVYDFTGFFQPIDNKDAAGNYILNRAKAGSAIPVKFSLDGAPVPGSNTGQGLDIMAAGFPSSGEIACSSSASADQVEETVPDASSRLTYDAGADQYVYAWKTDKLWAGKCRQLVLKLADGTVHRASFQLTK